MDKKVITLFLIVFILQNTLCSNAENKPTTEDIELEQQEKQEKQD